jgi:dUTP pyrophosphatase
MSIDTIKVPLSLSRGAVAPQYATVGSAGVDLCAAEAVELEPLERKRVWTGISVAIPLGYEGQVRPRSGLAFKLGLSMVNAPGTVDSDYRGEIGVILINLGQERITLNRGERIAQLVFCPITTAVFEEVDCLDTTDRGVGGFGSTGK